ncbi:tRNA glutamyl-Q(34) synthetase GluQRS [Sphingomonas ginkgonis]|uniref:tRNA glutamyl-Q(34) synthetase GluQRS n=1 Tax=Sphingomonas ginkgonis TaxID=2315330 RepID=UPI00163AABDD|nr:tRNA glutamyl-Q(34) synthetase GluQRS [Sphingomonas ginkgonis]
MTTTRFAPSPTGHLHIGHAYSAIVGRSYGDRWRLRIEDLDTGRSRPEFVGEIHADLQWLGLEWDGAVLVQSERSAAYASVLDNLRADGLAYPCYCTRADIAAALQAPHGDARARYPGTCRTLPDDPERRATRPHSWRLDAEKALERNGLPSWLELDGNRFATGCADFDDVILARKDAPAAYHLACVIDDATSGVDLVVRGEDLRSSTPVQRLLQLSLGLPEPRYLHHPLVLHADGRRLAKRDKAPTLAAMRADGIDGHALAAQLRKGRLPAGFRLGNA